MIAETGADRAVFWTRPQDIAFDPADPAAAMGDLGAEFPAAFFDGTVRAAASAADPTALAKFFTHRGGEPIEDEDWEAVFGG